MKKLAIIGLGLMGGSLGLAAKAKKLARCVSGYARREETRKEALKKHVVDEVYDSPEKAVKDANMVVFCLPVLTIPEIAAACLPHLAEGCVVTDVGSTKVELVTRMEKMLKNTTASFVGCHPIAGSQETGLGAALPDLYQGAAVILTPSCRKIDKTVSAVRKLWEGAGSRVFFMSPEEHDRTIARTSHLPHLVAAMLVNAIYRGGGDAGRFCGTGFRDTTRIAAGSEDMWLDIVKSNRVCVGRELAEFAKVLEQVSEKIKKGDFDAVKEFLADSRQKRLLFEEQFKRERRN